MQGKYPDNKRNAHIWNCCVVYNILHILTLSVPPDIFADIAGLHFLIFWEIIATFASIIVFEGLIRRLLPNRSDNQRKS